MFGYILCDLCRVLELRYVNLDQVKLTDGLESNIDLKLAKMGKTMKKVKYVRFECSTMLHRPLTTNLVLWFAL
jgi:hypothetical protein